MTRHPSFSQRVPDGDDRSRRVCDACGFVDYVNPRLVAGSVCVDDAGRILLCRRAIEPRLGFWTLPAGYMEEGEDVEEAARREAREEACARIAIDALLGVYSIARISQVQLMFRAALQSDVAAGPESTEVRMFPWDDLPWTELAFPTVGWALKDWRATKDRTSFPPFLRAAAS